MTVDEALHILRNPWDNAWSMVDAAIIQVADHMSAQAAQIEALTKDAARWRHWREHAADRDGCFRDREWTTLTLEYPPTDEDLGLDDTTDHAIMAKEAKS